MLLLFPGAGSSADHPSLVEIERWIAPHPCRRVDFPYRKQGRNVPDRAPVLLEAVRAEIATIDGPFVMGGRSMGGRMCSMIAAGADGLPIPAGLKGLVLISYPLHPPGKPDRLRIEHLPGIGVPTLFVSGDRDTFGTPAELRSATSTMPTKAKVRHLFVEGRGHDLKASDRTIAGAVADFLALVL
jgi:predicted alpha/beta-hydrolase family hydrolase